MLRGHVFARSDDESFDRFSFARGHRQSEVRQANAAIVADENIRGFEIPVHHAGVMHGRQSTSGAGEDLDNLSPGMRPSQPSEQVRSFDQGHGHEHHFARGAHLEQSDDVGMLDAR